MFCKAISTFFFHSYNFYTVSIRKKHVSLILSTSFTGPQCISAFQLLFLQSAATMPFKSRNAITLPVHRDEAAIDMVWVSEDILDKERKRRNSTLKKISTLRRSCKASKNRSTERTVEADDEGTVEDGDEMPLLESQD